MVWDLGSPSHSFVKWYSLNCDWDCDHTWICCLTTLHVLYHQRHDRITHLSPIMWSCRQFLDGPVHDFRIVLALDKLSFMNLCAYTYNIQRICQQHVSHVQVPNPTIFESYVVVYFVGPSCNCPPPVQLEQLLNSFICLQQWSTHKEFGTACLDLHLIIPLNSKEPELLRKDRKSVV